MFKVDDVYSIGTGHSVCEDYSYSGMFSNGCPYVVISDGCSASANTDIGARLLTHAMMSVFSLADLEDYTQDTRLISDAMLMRIYNKVSNVIQLLSLDVTSLDATIRMATIVKDKLFLIHFGDGYTIIRNQTTGEIVKNIYTYFDSNAPFYFPYYVRDDFKKKYIDLFASSNIECNGKTLNVLDYVDNINNFYTVIDLKDLADGEYSVSVMSDGIDTFYGSGTKIDSSEIINSILSFKNTTGEFVKRKVRKYLLQNVKNGIKYFDDISVASLIFKVGNDEKDIV